MTYTVLLERKAEEELKSLPAQILRRIDRSLQSLATEPVSRKATKLKGKNSEGWRIRVGDYSILYTIDEERKIINVYRIKHRREAYR